MSSGFLTEDNVALELTFKKLFSKLWPFLWHHKPKVIKAIAYVLAFVLVGRFLPYLFGKAVDIGIKEGQLQWLFYIAAGYFLIESIRMVLAFVQSRFIQNLGNTVLFEIREKMITHVQRLPARYFDQNPSGRTVTRVTNDVFALGEIFSQGFAAIFVNLIEILSIFVTLALISWQMTSVIMLIMPLLLVCCWYISHRIRFQFGASKRKLATINAYSAEALGGMKILQTFNKVDDAKNQFDALSLEYRVLQFKTVKLFATLWPVVEGFKVFTLAVALYFGAWLHTNSGMTLGQLTAYILLLQSFFNPLKTILERYNQLQNSLASADRVFQIFDEPTEPQGGLPVAEGRLKGKIEFRNLNFRYSNNGPYVLKDINLQIEPGMSVALVGRTGSGKTSIISLLQKLYPYNEGEILIDGISLNEIASHSLRPRVGVVQQDGFVFSGTLISNITLDNSTVTRERAAWAAEQAQCLDIIERHEGGLDSVVQERGLNLSAGERQLLAFARVLAFDPDILILDEATANIDSISERKIQTATNVVTRGRTSIIIAHRLSTILRCDLIVVLDAGRIVEAGKHDQLLLANGKYAQLYQSQFVQNVANAAEELRI